MSQLRLQRSKSIKLKIPTMPPLLSCACEFSCLFGIVFQQPTVVRQCVRGLFFRGEIGGSSIPTCRLNLDTDLSQRGKNVGRRARRDSRCRIHIWSPTSPQNKLLPVFAPHYTAVQQRLQQIDGGHVDPAFGKERGGGNGGGTHLSTSTHSLE